MTFVRVKRRLDEEPIEALLLAFKRRKVSNCVTPSGEISLKVENIFQFCGTLEDEEDNVFEVARSFREKSQNLKKDVKSRDHLAELSKQVRKEIKQEAVKIGRYKLVCHRRNASVDQESESETQANASLLPNPSVTNAAIARHPSHSKLQLFDLVNENDVVPVVKEEPISLNGVALVKEPNAQPFDYVYDLYYNDAWNAEDGFIDNLLSVQPYKQELYYGDYREENETADDDEDSNEENHYGNDYPSDEEYLRDGEDDDCGLGAAVKPWSLGDDSDEEDGLIYTRKASPVYSSYEAYKRRKQLEEQKDSESDSD